MKPVQKKTKEVEITERILGLFIWGINLDLDKADPEKVKAAGFKSLQEACEFWEQNKERFKPRLGGNQFNNIDNSVNTTLEYLNGYVPEWQR